MIGPQGAGKGTQADKLSTELNIPVFSTGDLYRKEIAEATPLGKKAKELIDEGKLVPDSVTDELVQKTLKDADISRGYILDGYPRNIAQLEAYLNFDQPTYAVFIDLADEDAVARLAGRRICEGCGKIYHVTNNPSKVADICDECDGTLVQRDDDQSEAIKERLRIYHDNTEPMLARLEELGVLRRIDGAGSIEEVYDLVSSQVL